MNTLNWEKMGGLLPAVIQDASSYGVLMVGYMNQEAFEETKRSQRVTFYSRSKERLWQKGETSGNVHKVVSIKADCDGDALLILVEPTGPTCHLGTTSCFQGGMSGHEIGFLAELESILEKRLKEQNPESYTIKLARQGISRIAQKVGEEGLEVALAAVESKPVPPEAADLLYHLLLLLKCQGHTLGDVVKVLYERHQQRTQSQRPS